ncbi:MAG: exodeoxyribonuclease III, partial [Caldimonas sp.]
MKIATFNVNGITARLPRLLEWLEESKPDIACLQELKTSDETFPAMALQAAGYGALWHGQKGFNGVAVLSRGEPPVERLRGLPGDPDDSHSRYLEVEAQGTIVASIYLPNGNPQPGPKFDYKLAWFDRLIAHSKSVLALPQTVVLAGDYNVVATDGVGDIYSPRSFKDDALLQPESRAAYRRMVELGWTDAIHSLHPGKAIYTYWDYFRNRFPRDAGLRIDHLMLNAAAATRLKEAGVDRAVRAREKPSDHAPTWVV